MKHRTYKQRKKREFRIAVNKATISLRGWTDIHTIRAIEYFLLNPKKK